MSEAPAAARYVFVIRVEASLYAVDGALVDHVSELGRVVPVPMAPPCFAGIVHERGRVLPVVDLALIFGGGRARAAYRRLVVMALIGRPVAVLAHEVLGLCEVEAGGLRPAPGHDAVVAGEVVDPRGVITVLDPEELLARLRGVAGPALDPEPAPEAYRAS